MTKVCRACNKEKDVSEFSKRSIEKDGLNRVCRECIAKRSREYYLKNKDALLKKGKLWAAKNREKCRGYEKKYRETHRPPKGRPKADPEKRKASANAYRQRHLEQRRERNRICAKKRRDKVRPQVRAKYHSNTNFKLRVCLRNRLRSILKGSPKPGSALEYLGCSVDELKAHLESLFLPGMTWDNWSCTGWHIDHKVPLSHFDLTIPEEAAKACHYTNLQPMWAVENMSKGSKIIHIRQIPTAPVP